MKKILAYLFMICGTAAVFFDGILPSCVLFALSLIGYISMPFFTQALVDGFFLTRNTYKYLLRIAFTAYLSQAVLLFIYVMWNKSPQPDRLNIVFSYLIAFFVLYGAELLVSLPRDRVASLNLLEPNQSSHSTRYGVVISSTDENNLPKGMKVPAWPRTTLHALAIVLFAICMTLLTFLPLTMSLLTVMSTLLFYFLHRWKIDNRVLVATIFYSAFAACYTYIYFRMTSTITWQAVSILGFLLCLLIPGKRRKKSARFYRALYLAYPLTIGICAAFAALLLR